MDDAIDSQKPSGPVKVKKVYTVWVDRNLCIGAATCVAVSPKVFAMDNEAKAVVLKTADEDTIENIIEAARACPVAAIFIEDEKGNRIFPK
ncbi:MAG: Ferredoxin [Candidatus Roizmanbacteria bacterium GW2011_GWA2_35_19]|uniref:Ferredoxin n=2 Tax=Candidatus Roizmaniibacteriota TaxID=1752723 RepID=A0A0G0EGW7_9BACT|nr:MAG: Ferredoxin [Candidatus Roizmanbacteria bacterium GW2011_GWC2_35_12]KKP74460.1 MAG: Ferredoxin [Candidatus Roizmanbacteria bacterium GW2011_GWA2_35_19]